jgi:hypothetical protein
MTTTLLSKTIATSPGAKSSPKTAVNKHKSRLTRERTCEEVEKAIQAHFSRYRDKKARPGPLTRDKTEDMHLYLLNYL